ncbi:MAG TPA: prolipoprotein diacylglyceryl transferase [Ilumatobacter sp.]|nr:prolipoprotein diacylglyceryl transferase [Ilumatobacter sp.]
MPIIVPTALLASIPSPSFDRISIGPLNLRLYGLMIALGVIAAVWLFGKRLEERGYGTRDDASAIGMWGVAGGVVGARLYHVVTDWHRFKDNLGDIPKIWEGGLGVPGGIALGVVVGVYAGRQRGIPPLVVMSLAAPSLPLAQAIGRWGNWFNQELYGRPTDLPWALEIDPAHNAGHPEGTTFHPAFLYESLWNLALCGVLLWIDRRWGNRLAPGKLLAVYVLGYGVGRLWIESLRIDPASELGGLRWNQWMAMALIVGGIVWLVAGRRREWPVPASPAHDDVLPDDVLDDVLPDDESFDELAALDGVDPDALDPDTLDAVADPPEFPELDRADP